jgi:hypothetical protein
MLFFLKKSKIVIDCFTDNPAVLEQYPIKNAANFIPEKWKKLPKETIVKTPIEIPSSTIKRCIAFIDLYRSGFMLPLWSDLIIDLTVEDIAGWRFANSTFSITNHTNDSMWDDLYKNHTHAKLLSPWFFKEKSGVKFSWNKPTWNIFKENLEIVPGVVNFKNQNGTHINLFVKDYTRLELKAGTPLVHLIPLSDKQVEIKNHLISGEEFRKLYHLNTPLTFAKSFES